MKQLYYSFSVFLFASLINLGLNAQNSLNYGPRTKSLAGAGTAMVENSLLGNLNPGGQVFLGQKVAIGIDLSLIHNSYKVIGEPNTFDSSLETKWPLGLETGLYEAENKTIVIPQIAFNTKINDKSTLGIVVYGNGNRGVEYSGKIYYSPVIAGFGSSEGFVNPMGPVSEPSLFKFNQYFAAFTYSRKFGEKLGVGLSVIGAWQSLSIQGLEAFGTLHYSSNPDKLTNNNATNALGVGGKLGVQWNISEKFQAGVTFRTKIWMSSFESYEGFIGESGKIDAPSEWSIGLLYHPFERFKMVLDVNRICYSGVDSWGLPMIQDNLSTLGGANGGGFGRKDQMNYKFGVEYRIPKWSFRAGYQHSDLTIVREEVLLNILMPDVIEDFIAFGFSRDIGKQSIHFSVIKGFENTFMGINGLDPIQNIELASDMWNFEIAVEF